MSQRSPSPAAGLTLAGTPDRVRLRELQELLEEKRDAVAALDLELEILRHTLSDFEARYRWALAEEHATLLRVQAVVRHLERWEELLRDARGEDWGARSRGFESHRARDFRRAESARRQAGPAPKRAEAPAPEDASYAQERAARLKSVYRALARRYHPDLASTEEEQAAMGEMMARINALYREGDLDALEQLMEQAQAAEPEPEPNAGGGLAEQVARLAERVAQVQRIIDNLLDEQRALEQSATGRLLQTVEAARAAGRSAIAELKRELDRRAERATRDVRNAAGSLENAVKRFNALDTSNPVSLDRAFDPYADKQLVRLGLEALRMPKPAVRARADSVEQLAQSAPSRLRLLLLAHVAELSDLPLDGLATYEDVALRFDHLNREEPEAPSLERTLVDAADLVEFGVRRSGERTVQAGLRFRDAELREAIPHALAAHGVRREFKRVLWALGERRRCGDCEREVFAVPLYRTRGLDDLRANVCPECGNIFQSYRMPKGKDMQAVLNDAFLDLGLVVEWSFQLGRASLGLQMVSAQADPLTVGALKDRLFGELFERYRLDLTREQVFLSQSGGAADPNTPAAELLETAFRISFTADARVSPAKALEQIRHRIRTRFQPDEPPTQPSVG